MSTPDRSAEDAVTVPGELRPAVTHPPVPTNALDAPTRAPTPGLAGAILKVPGGPTLPEFDPNSMAQLLSRMATELYRAPPNAPEAPSASSVSPTTPNALQKSEENLPLPGGARGRGTPVESPKESQGVIPSLGPAPTTTTAPPTSASLPAAPPHAPTTTVSAPSPFDAPPNFDSLFGVSGLPTALPLSIPLFDARPERAPEPTQPKSVDRFQLEPSTGYSQLGSGSSLFDPHALRREFPILQERVNGKPLVWLDNAATTQKPRTVIDRLTHFYERENSNIHRAAHTLAARATDAYEGARESVRRFINAPSTKEIVFVRGATEGINLVAQSWGRRYVEAGDEIVITWLEHHANIVPWQQLAAEKGARLRIAPVDDRGQLILEEYEKLLGPKTRLVSITQVSNALGTINPVREMVSLAHRHGARVLVDGAQGVSHLRVDVQALDCDWFVFSGHKVFAPTGIGAVYGKADVLDESPPWQGGGNMIQDVTFERTKYHPAPARFEAGTGNIADAVGLGAALDWLTRVGLENVSAYEHELLVCATERLLEVPGLRLYGTAPEKAGVLSFTLEGHKTEQVGGLLDREGIAVRSGHHCAQPILRRLGVEATVRASLAPYNTYEDLDALVAALHRLQAGR